MTIGRTIVHAALLACAGSVSGHAADLTLKDAPVSSATTEAFDPFQVRIRALGVLPQGHGYIDQMPGHAVTVEHAVIPELDVSYFFTRNIAVEAICCVSKNSIYVGGVAGKNSDTWLFPPTVLAQWHFTNFGAFQPYIGVGVNYTHYFHTVTYQDLYGSLKDTWGVAGQVGFDYMFDRHWGVNVDVKRILMQPNFYVQATSTVGLTGQARIDPWIIGAGVTYRFGGR